MNLKDPINIRELFHSTVKGLQKDHPRLSQGLVKWQSKIMSNINKLNMHSVYSREDIFQEVVYYLVQMDKSYDKIIYKYGEKHFTLKEKHSMLKDKWTGMCTLVSNDRSKQEICVLESELEEVTKVSYSSMVFKSVEQTCINMYRASKCNKRSSGKGKRPVELSFETPFSSEEGLALEDVLATSDFNPEEGYIFKSSVHEIGKNLSKPARKVLNAMFVEPLVTPQSLVAPLHMSLVKTTQAKKELKRIMLASTGQEHKSKKRPIHFSASVIS